MDQTPRDIDPPAAVTRLDGVRPDKALRRTRLREFQAQLVERMQAAQTGTRLSASQLGVMIGQVRYLLDLREAGEIVSAGSMTKVPLTKDWYLGLSNIRGSLTSVVDLARFEGRDVTNVDNSCRVVAFAPSLSFNSGLLVSQVLGLRNAADMEEQLVSDNTDEHSYKPWMIKKYRDRDANIWVELSLAALIQDQDFLQVGL
ncbi:twitching motility protein PilI [Undibacterium sp. GrIS 1.2]|uniref:chemotaxis protein CheW n=1 Tax=Undibacterium sp. GrIS 1.2 TaxID=3143933 RepID=UPI003394B5AC